MSLAGKINYDNLSVDYSFQLFPKCLLASVPLCLSRYERAEKHFEEALKLVRSIDDSVAEKWEPLLNNLGHVSRKLCKFSEALDYHQQVRNIPIFYRFL